MHCLLLVSLLCAAQDPPSPQWAEVQSGGKTILVHPKCRALGAPHLGPFVKLGDGSVLAVDRRHVLVSSDEGKASQAIRATYGRRIVDRSGS